MKMPSRKRVEIAAPKGCPFNANMLFASQQHVIPNTIKHKIWASAFKAHPNASSKLKTSSSPNARTNADLNLIETAITFASNAQYHLPQQRVEYKSSASYSVLLTRAKFNV